MDDANPLFDALTNLGRWGPGDERGTLNLVTPEVVIRAVSTVRHGRVVSLARELRPGEQLPLPSFVKQRMISQPDDQSGALDSIEISPHGFAITHVDALSHVYFRGSAYNGTPASDAVTADGVLFGDIAALSGGIVTRGVLLDIAAARSVHHLDPKDVVTAGDLDSAEMQTGLTVLPGDAVIVRTGIEHQEPEDRLSSLQRTGIDASCVAWMRHRDVAVYAGDCIEARPSTDELDMPLHKIGLAGMGLILVDAPIVEPLVEICLALAQFEFLFVCAPLPIRGGTGSAVNPLAIL